jgi:hypothetical protein
MKRILEQLRGVVGVNGVVILDRITGVADSLIPVRFSQNQREELEELLRIMTIEFEDDSAFKIRFKSGWLMIKSVDDFAILIMAREDLNFDTLKLVMKSSIVSLRATSSSTAPSKKVTEISVDQMTVLLDAFNSVSEYLMTASEIGPYGISTLLRSSREDIVDRFPDLKNFAVDNNGRVELIRGASRRLDSQVVEAVAWWSLAFRDRVNAKKPVFGLDIRAVTAKYEEELNSLGFYAAYRRASSQPVKG